MIRGKRDLARAGVVTLLASMTLLAAEGLPRRGLMGVMLSPVTDENKEQLGLTEARGVVITSVTPDSAAAKAGVKANDVIIKLDDQDVTDLPGLQRSLRKYFAGDTVKFTLLRDKDISPSIR
jgi:S1-C subfamily serine protease